MGIFKRLFRIGAAEANAALDKMEDPVKMTEQGIRDMKADLNTSLKGLAEIKALAIRTRREMSEAKNEAAQYEQKAIMLVQKAEQGAIDIAEADRLANEALSRKQQAAERAVMTGQTLQQQEAQVAQMESNINRLKSQIGKWENEAKTLKARVRVSQASAKVNKQLANIDSSSTVALLEKMKEKVDQQEALAQSYGEIADANKSVDDEINQALGSSNPTLQIGSGGTGAGSDASAGMSDLDKLKAKLNAGKQ